MRKSLPFLALVTCAIGFVVGLGYLFRLRFDAGDVYPEYSSLRADPLGTMAFFESLEQMPGLSVRRDYSSNNELPRGKDITYLHLAARSQDWRLLDEELFKEIEGFLISGGHLAVTFRPEIAQPWRIFSNSDDPENPERKTAAKPGKRKSKRQEEDAKRLLKRISLKERWGLEFGYLRLQPGVGADVGLARVDNQMQEDLPETLEWHSATIFTNLSSSWRTIYTRGTNPVVVERNFGSGTIVLASDSFFLSNEALRKDRHADLLSWWIGPGKKILFDEAHFGIIESEGVAALIRKYRLYGFVASLMVLAGLFIWKESRLFTPMFEPRREEFIAGKEAFTGFVNLLRRNIRRRDLLNVCFGEWEKSFRKNVRQTHTSAKYVQAEAVLQAHKSAPQDPGATLSCYRELCRLLKKI